MKLPRAISGIASISLVAAGLTAITPTASAADIVDWTSTPQVVFCSANHVTFESCKAQKNRVPSTASLRVYVQMGESQYLAGTYGVLATKQPTPYDSSGRAVGSNYGWLYSFANYTDELNRDGQATTLPEDWQDLTNKVGTYTYQILGGSHGRWVNSNWYNIKSPNVTGSFTIYNPAATSGWKKSGGKWYYYVNGRKATGWMRINGSWYYFNSKGQMLTGWRNLAGNRYYFNGKGQMLTGLRTLDGKKYYFNSKGHMMTGLRTVGRYRYYFASNGQAQRGWRTLSGKRYYFRSNYTAATGWQTIGGKRYYFNSQGVLIKTP